MALFWGDTAVVSLGLSCQTALQFEGWAASKTRAAEVHVTPIDWLMAPATSVAQMIDRWAFLPTAEEVESVPHARLPHGRYCRWADLNVHYLHDADLVADRPTSESKTRHTVETLRSVAERGRRVFILSNTQNNLPTFDRVIAPGWYRLDEAGVSAVRAALERRFGQIELYVVGYADRCGEIISADRVFLLQPDASRVRGDNAQWRGVLNAVCGQTTA